MSVAAAAVQAVHAEEMRVRNAISMWHSRPFACELHDYLALAWEEYVHWVDHGELPAGYTLPAGRDQ